MSSSPRGLRVKHEMSDVELECRASLFSIAKRKHPRERQRSPSPQTLQRLAEQQQSEVPQDSTTNQLSLYHSGLLRQSATRGEAEDALERIENMCERKIPPHQDAFSRFVAMLAAKGRLAEAEDWLRRSDSPALHPVLAGLQADEMSCNALLIAYGQSQDVLGAERMASEMVARELKISGRSYMALVRACLDQKEVRRAHHWAYTMTEAGYDRPGKAIMAELIRGLAEAGNTSSADDWLRYMGTRRGVKLDESVYEFVRDRAPCEIVPAGLSGEGEPRKPLVQLPTVGGRPPPPLCMVADATEDQVDIQSPGVLTQVESTARSETRPTTAGSCQTPRGQATPRSQDTLTPRSRKGIPRILVASGGLAMKVGRMEASAWGKAEPRKGGLQLALSMFKVSSPTPDYGKDF